MNYEFEIITSVKIRTAPERAWKNCLRFLFLKSCRIRTASEATNIIFYSSASTTQYRESKRQKTCRPKHLSIKYWQNVKKENCTTCVISKLFITIIGGCSKKTYVFYVTTDGKWSSRFALRVNFSSDDCLSSKRNFTQQNTYTTINIQAKLYQAYNFLLVDRGAVAWKVFLEAIGRCLSSIVINRSIKKIAVLQKI